MKHKSYNPFKMWGSYIGAVIVFLLLTLILTTASLDLFKVTSTGDYITLFEQSNPNNFYAPTDIFNNYIDGLQATAGILHFQIVKNDIPLVDLKETDIIEETFLYSPSFLFFTFIIVIFGFLLGWTIHSIFRSLRK